MSERPQDAMVKVIKDSFPWVCDGVEELYLAPGGTADFQPGWQGRYWGYDLPWRLRMWFIDAFVSNPAERYRIRLTLAAAREWLLGLAAWEYATTGRPVHVPEELVLSLQRHLLANGLKPNVYEIATGATTHPASVASANFKKLMEVNRWTE